MLTSVTSLCYLVLNQSENCAGANHAPCNSLPNLAFKNPSLKAIKEFGSFEHLLALLLEWPCSKHCTFLYHNPISVDWFYSKKANEPKFRLVTPPLPQLYGSWGRRFFKIIMKKKKSEVFDSFHLLSSLKPIKFG